MSKRNSNSGFRVGLLFYFSHLELCASALRKANLLVLFLLYAADLFPVRERYESGSNRVGYKSLGNGSRHKREPYPADASQQIKQAWIRTPNGVRVLESKTPRPGSIELDGASFWRTLKLQ